LSFVKITVLTPNAAVDDDAMMMMTIHLSVTYHHGPRAHGVDHLNLE
jgi:hypothetical protein